MDTEYIKEVINKGMFVPDENPVQVCEHPDHFPPSYWIPPSSGTWKCPSCGHGTRIEKPMFNV